MSTGVCLNQGYIKKISNKGETLVTGSLLDESRLILPWLYELHHDDEEDLMMSDFYDGPNLMSKALSSALMNKGIDTIQYFPAEIKNTLNGDVIFDFVVSNIMCLVMCADMDKSETLPLANGVFFTKLKIDESKVAGLDIFRLRESAADVIVSEKVRRIIVDGGFRDIEFIKV